MKFIIIVILILLSWASSLSQGSCTFVNDNLYYLGGEDKYGAKNKYIYELDFDSVVDLKHRFPWKRIGIKLDDSQTYQSGNVYNLGRNRIAISGEKRSEIGDKFVIIDFNKCQVTTLESNENSPSLKRESGNYTFVSSSVSKRDERSYLHYGGQVEVDQEHISNLKLRVFDTITLEWSFLPGEGPSSFQSISGYFDHQFFVFRKINEFENAVFDEASIYDIRSGEWVTKLTTGSIPTPRMNPTFTQGDKFLYMTGGFFETESKNDFNLVYSLDLSTLVWTKHSIFMFTSNTLKGCLIYHRGILVSGFGYFGSDRRPTYMINTRNWSLIDYQSLANTGTSIAKAFNSNLFNHPDEKPVDDTSLTVDSIKFIHEAPIQTSYIVMIIFLIILSLVVIVILIYLIYRRRRSLKEISKPDPILDHVWCDPSLRPTSMISYSMSIEPDFDVKVTTEMLMDNSYNHRYT